MTDFTRSNLHVRYWTPYSLSGIWVNLCCWFRNGFPAPVEFGLRTIAHYNGRCYCPVGSESEVRMIVLGFGLWVWYDRGVPKYPCLCDRVMSGATK